MSRARLVVSAVVVEGRTHAEVAASYGLSRSQVTKLVARYQAEGDAAFEPRSRRSLNRSTPAAVYNRLPKAAHDQNGSGTHWRTRQDRVDKTGTVTLRHNGKLHHIGIGRKHKGTPITLLVADFHIRVIATQTGELLRHLTLNPDTDYQPQNQP